MRGTKGLVIPRPSGRQYGRLGVVLTTELRSFHPVVDILIAEELIADGRLRVNPERLKELLSQGVQVWTDCPDRVETSPGIFTCPGHPVGGNH